MRKNNNNHLTYVGMYIYYFMNTVYKIVFINGKWVHIVVFKKIIFKNYLKYYTV